MGRYTESQKKATQKYNKANYDDVKVRVPKGMRETYKSLADSLGTSLNQLIIDLLDETLSKNKKYIVIDVKNDDDFSKGFATLDEAIAYADNGWNHLTDMEKKKREAYYILESINPDEEADNHYDGNIVKNYK